MPYYRKLPSGMWQATVRGPDGRRHSETDKLKSVVRTWALAQEARFSQGEVRDPRAGEVRVGDWHARYAAASGVEQITAAKNASLWATHCEPKWAGWRMSAVTKMEAQGWVAELRATRRARHQGRPAEGDEVPFLSAATIADIVHIMSALYRAAMREHPPVVIANPFADLELPRIEPRPVEFYEPDEAVALYAAAGELGARWRTMTELGMQVGLRPGEIYGLRGHRVDWLGGPVTDEHFRNRVWYPAVAEAGVRRFPPRIMRNTAASWLVQDGVPLYDVQALLGHEDYATTQRYAHLAQDAHGKVIESWTRRLDAPVTHGRGKARPSR